MPKPPLPTLLLAASLSAAVYAQTPATPAPQLSPKAAYDEAMHPLELTRHSISNWSDTEVGALTVAMANAAKACAARNPKDFTGSDLIDLSKLCALGQSFPAVVDATTRYITAPSEAGPKPQLTLAYAGLVDAQLHLKDEPSALASAKAMLAAVPYDSLTADTIDEAIDFMHFVYTTDALTLALARQPLLLARIAAIAATPPSPQPSPLSPSAQDQSLYELYADGIALASLQQLYKAPPQAIAATVTTLDAALPTALSPDDSIPIALSRRRYALLGKPLPDIAHPAHPANPKHPVLFTTLGYPPTLPQIPAANAITALLLFPDWCAQCLRLGTKLPQTVVSVAGHEAYYYGLLAETVPPNPPPTTESNTPKPFTPADAVNDLENTPTLTVDPSLLDDFAATDVPFLILTDSQGIIRVLQPVSDDALIPGGTIDSAIARVGAQWHSPGLPPAPAPPVKQP